MERDAYRRQVCVGSVSFLFITGHLCQAQRKVKLKEQNGKRLLVRMVGNGCTFYSQYILPYMGFALIAPVRVFGNVPSS